MKAVIYTRVSSRGQEETGYSLPAQEKLNWGIRIILAKNYIENLSEEIKKGQMEKIVQGWLPGTPPLGYKLVGQEKHKIAVIDDTKAPLVYFFLFFSFFCIKSITNWVSILNLISHLWVCLYNCFCHIFGSSLFHVGSWNFK